MPLPSSAYVDLMRDEIFTVIYEPKDFDLEKAKKTGNYEDYFLMRLLINMNQENDLNQIIEDICSVWRHDDLLIREDDTIVSQTEKSGIVLMKIKPRCSNAFFYAIEVENKIYGIYVIKYIGEEGYKLLEDILLNIRVSDETSS